MKSVLKNIIIILEFLVILMLSVLVIFVYRNNGKGKTVETLANAEEKKEAIYYERIERKVNREVIADYLVYGLTDHTEKTFFQNIFPSKSPCRPLCSLHK